VFFSWSVRAPVVQGGLAFTLVETEEGCLESKEGRHAWWWWWWKGRGWDVEWMHQADASIIDRAR